MGPRLKNEYSLLKSREAEYSIFFLKKMTQTPSPYKEMKRFQLFSHIQRGERAFIDYPGFKMHLRLKRHMCIWKPNM